MMYSRLSFSCSRCVSSRRLLCSNLAANFSLIVNESLAPLTFSPLSEPPPLPLSEPLLLPLSESEPLSLSLLQHLRQSYHCRLLQLLYWQY